MDLVEYLISNGYFEALYYLVATIAFPFAAGWAILQWKDAVRQRKRQLRWDQAEAAWKILDKTFEDPESRIAYELIDNERDTIDLPGPRTVKVTLESVKKALDLKLQDNSAESLVIRYAFNCVLYNFERLEAAIVSGYVLEEDVCVPTKYYSKQLKCLRRELNPYAKEVGYKGALRLIDRFTEDSTEDL